MSEEQSGFRFKLTTESVITIVIAVISMSWSFGVSEFRISRLEEDNRVLKAKLDTLQTRYSNYDMRLNNVSRTENSQRDNMTRLVEKYTKLSNDLVHLDYEQRKIKSDMENIHKTKLEESTVVTNLKSDISRIDNEQAKLKADVKGLSLKTIVSETGQEQLQQQVQQQQQQIQQVQQQVQQQGGR